MSHLGITDCCSFCSCLWSTLFFDAIFPVLVYHEAEMNLNKSMNNEKNYHFPFHTPCKPLHAFIHTTCLQGFHDSSLLTFFNHETLFLNDLITTSNHNDVPEHTKYTVSCEEIHSCHN